MNVWKISTKKDENIVLKTTEKESRKLDDFLSGESMAKNWDPTLRIYVDKKVLKDYFVQAQPDEKCCICGKEDVIFYAGYAYENGKCIVFSADQERFCSDCLVTGRAAKERNIVFNCGLIEGFSDMQEEKKQTLLYGTPGVRHNFDTNEDLWPVCCNDFCCMSLLC